MASARAHKKALSRPMLTSEFVSVVRSCCTEASSLALASDPERKSRPDAGVANLRAVLLLLPGQRCISEHLNAHGSWCTLHREHGVTSYAPTLFERAETLVGILTEHF